MLCRTEYTVTVNPNPVSNDVSNLILCDDTSVGNDTDGFISNFDLDSQTSIF